MIMKGLKGFIRLSNMIEGINRQPYVKEINGTAKFLGEPLLTTPVIENLVGIYEPDARLRCHEGMNVRVGSYIPNPGGPWIRANLEDLIKKINQGKVSAFDAHQQYETLHPFTDCNGRSGRAIWARQMITNGKDPFKLPLSFLHIWYYQSLENHRKHAS